MAKSKVRGVFEHPRGSGVYWILYYHKKNRHRERVGRRQDAVDRYFLRKSQIRAGTFTPPRADGGHVTTLRELVSEALESKKHRVKASSYKTELGRIKKILREYGDEPASAITPARVQAILDGLRREDLLGSTVNRYRSALSTAFAFAVQAGRVPHNPVRDVARYKEPKHRIRYLLEDEEPKLRLAIRATHPDFEHEIDFALNTGARRNELFNLKWKDVRIEDAKNGKAYVDGKTGQTILTLNESAIVALEELRKITGGRVAVVPGSKAEGKRDSRRWFEDAVKAAGIESFTYHDLRHTYGSRLAMAGQEAFTIRALMRHTSLEMTKRYTHLNEKHTAEAANKIGRQR